MAEAQRQEELFEEEQTEEVETGSEPSELRDVLESAFEAEPEEVEAQPEVEAVAEDPAPAEIQPGPKAEAPDQSEPPAASLPVDRAPASWAKETAESWAQIPEAARVQILQRERQVDSVLRESADSRKFTEALLERINPYKALIDAEGATPIQAIESLLQTGAKLRTSTAPELANLIAGMVTQFGTGRFGPQFVQMLDQSLTGFAQGQPQAPAAQPDISAQVQQQIAPMQDYIQQLQQREAQHQAATQAQVDSEVEQFLLTQPHAEELRETMADVVEIADRQGRTVTLQEAYETAMRMHPQLGQLVVEKAASERAATETKRAQRARSNNLSVKGGPPRSDAEDDNDSVRGAIESALASHSR